MRNEQAKQEAIKKAYGHNYKLCNPDENGWIYHKVISHGRETLNHPHNFGYTDNTAIIETDSDHSNPGNYRWRLRKISFIENNNGWIRIEPDGSNLPTDSNAQYKVCRKEIIHKTTYNLRELLDLHEEYELTHYKPITPELKPIY